MLFMLSKINFNEGSHGMQKTSQSPIANNRKMELYTQSEQQQFQKRKESKKKNEKERRKKKTC